MATDEYVLAECGVRLAQARYADAVFRKDFAAFAECLTENSEWRVGGSVFRGRAECTAFLQDRLIELRWVAMTFRTPILELGEGVASGRTYVTEQMAFLDGRNNASVATYYERFALAGGVWRRGFAFFQLHYLGPPDFSGQFFPQPDFGPPPAMPPLDAVAATSLR